MSEPSTVPGAGSSSESQGAASIPVSPSPRPRIGTVSAGMLWAVAFAALGIVGWQWYDSRTQFAALKEELAQRLSQGDTRNKEALGVAQDVRMRVRELESQVSSLEGGLAESQNQQIALEALYQQLSRSNDEWALAEIEQTLTIAAQQLQLAGNVKAALLALQTVDGRLQRLDRPQLAPLRKVIERDIDRLQRSPYVDVVGVSVKIDNLIDTVDALPLAMQQRPPPGEPQAMADEPSHPLMRLAREMWQDLRSLVRIQTVERPEVPLLDPGQEYFLRENLKLRLLSARIALLQRDGKTYRADLTAARQWVERFYDTRERNLAITLATLRQLADVDVGVDVPDINGSLNGVRDYKLTRDKGNR